MDELFSRVICFLMAVFLSVYILLDKSMIACRWQSEVAGQPRPVIESAVLLGVEASLWLLPLLVTLRHQDYGETVQQSTSMTS